MKLSFSNILFKYLAKNFIFSFLIVFICFFFITSLLEGMEIVRRISYGYTANHTIIFKLIFLKTVSTISLFFPFVLFISAILFYLIINNKMELTSIRGFGVSNKKIAQGLGLLTLSIGIFYIAIFDTISALSVEKVKQIESIVFHKHDSGDSGITITNSGLWFRDVSESNSYIICAKSFSQSSNSLTHIRFFQFDSDMQFEKSIYSKEAKIVDEGQWVIEDSVIIDSEGNKTENDIVKIPTKLSLKNINRMTTDPRSIAFWNITQYVTMLEKVGLSTLRYRMQLYIQISSIIQMIAFVFLASIFCISYNNRDLKRYSCKVASAIIIAFPIHFTNNVLIAFGANETLSPVLATLFLPAILALFFMFYISKK